MDMKTGNENRTGWRRRVSLFSGDITQLRCDAIVNAANQTLLGGGGVDGAIHRAAGPGLREECRKLGGCATAQAKITSGHRLHASYIIHTVGPIWRGGDMHEDDHLAACYRNALALSIQFGIKTIAFPAISTGAYGFPRHRAAEIAVREVATFLEKDRSIEKVIFVCHDDENCMIYKELLGP
jgi:O-acetyl-ADP-ribose deacetylase (regulator of RNase III)